MNAKALFQLSYGLYVVSTKHDKKMNGCIINTVTQVTDDPKQIVVAINKKNLTCELIQKSGILSVSVLSETAPFSLFQHFGFQSGNIVDKFVDFPFSMTAQELPYLTEHTTAYLDCKVVNSYDLGSHMLFLAVVSDCDVISGDKVDGNCTGIKVYVGNDGKAHFSISNSAEDPFIAIHADSKL